jgi:hypothetical protein
MKVGPKLRVTLRVSTLTIVGMVCASLACGAAPSPPEDASSATVTTAAQVQSSQVIEPPPWHDEATSNALPEVVSGDTQIVATLEAIVSAELNLARVASQRTESRDARDLAYRTAEEFGASSRRLAEAAGLHAIRRVETPIADTLHAFASQSLTRLLATRGADFDRAFLRTLALTAIRQIDALDDLPADPQWGELRAEIAEVRARLSASVTTARRLDEGMNTAHP